MTFVQYIRIFVIYFLRIALRCFYVFPVKKNRMLFSSFEGRQFSCNPKYVYLYVKERFGDQYEYVWVLNDSSKFNENARAVKFLSIGHLYYLLTSKFIISNLGIEPFVPKRKSQIFINTWHGGGAYKRADTSMVIVSNIKKYMTVMINLRKNMTDACISSCESFTKVMSQAWNIPEEKFLAIGMPRNDIFFKNNGCLLVIMKKVRNYFHIKDEIGIILYAPTFRGIPSFRSHSISLVNEEKSNNVYESLDIDHMLRSAELKFCKKFVVLQRFHVGYDQNIFEGCISATEYPDMQELLCAADILITDYSSTIWDYAFTAKPCFLYMPDLEEYRKNVSFYTPLEDWPFLYATTNSKLCDNIKNFDATKHKTRIELHLNKLMSFENGYACEALSEYMGLFR